MCCLGGVLFGWCVVWVVCCLGGGVFGWWGVWVVCCLGGGVFGCSWQFASKLHGFNATLIIFVFLLYFIVLYFI